MAMMTIYDLLVREGFKPNKPTKKQDNKPTKKNGGNKA